MDTRLAETTTSVYALFNWISAFVFFIIALGVTFFTPFAVTMMFTMNPMVMPGGMPLLAVQQLSTGIGVIMGIFLFLLSALFFAIGVGLWRRERWARYGAIVESIFWLFALPIGTIVGAFGIYAFAFDATVNKEFGGPSRSATRSSARKKKR